MARSILVTGGAGYIGSVVVEQLLALGHSVVVLDDLSRGHRAAVDPRAEFVRGGIADRRVLDELLARRACDALVHLAAYALVAESVAHPQMYFTNNVTGGQVLLDAAVGAAVRRVILSSSGAVYGHPPVIPIPEDAPRAPVNPYGETKLAFERLLADYATRHGVGSISLRYFNAAGATARHGEDHDPETHLIPTVLQVALGRRPAVEVYGTDYPPAPGSGTGRTRPGIRTDLFACFSGGGLNPCCCYRWVGRCRRRPGSWCSPRAARRSSCSRSWSSSPSSPGTSFF